MVNNKPMNKENGVKKYSILSIVSFALCLLAILLAFFNVTTNATGMIKSQELKYFFGGLLIFVSFTSTLLAFIDILSKNKKKLFAIISLVMSGGFFGLVLLIVTVLTLYTLGK